MISFFISTFNYLRFIFKVKENSTIIFFSESKYYIDHFEDLVLEIKKNYNDIIYITTDSVENNYFKKSIYTILIENKVILEILFAFIKCKCLIMTVTDLGNHLKKSKYCKNYVYFFHALSSVTRRYTREAFKNYDIILTNGNYQKKELELLEKKYLHPKKKIVNTGYFFLDKLSKKANIKRKVNNCVLFAPSWSYKKNLFENYSLEIIDRLIKDNFSVILRPHPEHYKRSINTINSIKKKFMDNSNFEFDERLSNLESMEKASVLITDNSAIDMEYVLIFERPVVQIQYIDKIHNDFDDIRELTSMENDFKKQFTIKLDVKEINKLNQIIKKIDKRNIGEKINFFKKKYLSHEGNSTVFASNFILKEVIR